MIVTVLIFIGVAIIMHIISVRKMNEAINETNGIIRTYHHLNVVKEAINVNMKLAILYMVLFGILVVLLIIKVMDGMPMTGAALALFLFGVITFPVSLHGKKYENKIRNMKVEADDPQIAAKYQDYLKQWSGAAFQLRD
ncbi:MAG: hypothetical protein A2Y62_21360 [Candidatus Fischerbacteria bacterium RBG_13_37_8]|uniref:Uncharacterized protein n=1 Tax=Candidatus Fischerbacteria bacterium RBG_13_37_8 TaxID=1817863 RepID=A0A1F5VTH3_9BACT|nr:MAG: hypothetical protein A2Y62_21360 [Candidatus Fischerbacteria bacterium RBG_13_37_8]